jgi:hypothetical protein
VSALESRLSALEQRLGTAPGTGDLDERLERAAYLDPTSLAEQMERLSGELERLKDLLRQHGIESEDGTA